MCLIENATTEYHCPKNNNVCLASFEDIWYFGGKLRKKEFSLLFASVVPYTEINGTSK